MKLLFSGAKHFKSEQRDINQSLGGLMSSTPVPNGKLNAVFSELSAYDLKNKGFNTIGLFFYNDGNSPIESIVLETIYQNKLGTPINLCDIEYSISQVSEKGYIEQIGSIEEEPFYAEWFECESRYEDCTLKLKYPGNIGDEVSIFGTLGFLTGNTLESLASDLKRIINESGNLECTVVDERTLYVRNKNIEISGLNSDFVTDGFAALYSDQSLANGKDGKTLIFENLLPDQAFGIWIKRIINDNHLKLSNNCDGVNIMNSENKETLVINFHLD